MFVASRFEPAQRVHRSPVVSDFKITLRLAGGLGKNLANGRTLPNIIPDLNSQLVQVSINGKTAFAMVDNDQLAITLEWSGKNNFSQSHRAQGPSWQGFDGDSTKEGLAGSFVLAERLEDFSFNGRGELAFQREQSWRFLELQGIGFLIFKIFQRRVDLDRKSVV